MLKSWICRLMVALLFASLAGYPLQAGAQANQLFGRQASSPSRQAMEANRGFLPPGFQIVATTKSSLVLDIQSPSYKFETTQDNARSCQSLQAEGYLQNADPGEPGLLSAGVMIGIPLDATPTIQIQSIETVDLPGQIHLCPVATPQVARDPSGLPRSMGDVFSENTLAYSRDVFLPTQPIELVSSGRIRSQRVAQLRFMPFQYNPARDALHLIRRITVQIQLGNEAALSNSLPLVDEGPFEALLQKTLINYDQARSWRSQTQQNPALPAFPAPAVPQDLPAYKIQVNQDGLYQVTYEALQSAGLPVDSLDPRTFRVLNQGVEVPVILFGEEDGVFNPGDTLLFYGQKVATRYTDTNIYWLSWGAGNGLRMAALNGAVTGSATPAAYYQTTLHLEEDHEYWSTDASGPQNDHWYWAFLNAYNSPVTQTITFTMQNLGSGPLTASFRGLLKGSYASPQHHTRISLNSHLLDDQTWPSTGEHTFSVDILQSYLIQGTNTISIECPRDGGITQDQVLVNWFEIDYYHTYTAEHNQLDFGGDQTGLSEFQVEGFSSSAIEVFDITDPSAPDRILGGSVFPNGLLYQINFEQQVDGVYRYLALTPSGWLTPAAITLDTPSTLKSPSNAADYIIISHPDFLDAILPLATYRAGFGLRVKVVDVQDIYDEFNGGVFDPNAIHSFLSYTYSHWSAPAPSYVLLVGDGHYDFKDNYGDSGPNYIPPFLGDFDPWIGETAADNRYVTISGSDTLPDMYIGRLPANSPPETTAMVTKIMTYEQDPIQGDWTTRLTFVADDPEPGGNFPQNSDAIADHYLSPGFNAEKIYYGVTHTTIPGARAAILAAINQGRLIVHFTGHASTQSWAAENLFWVSNIASLTNAGKYPFFVPMTCAEGYFIFPKAQSFNYPSLAESLVRADGKGAIASFSPAGFGLSNGHDFLAKGLYHAIFNDGTIQLGPASTFAKYYLSANSTGNLDLIDTYMLFGDPATRLRTNPVAALLSSFTGVDLHGTIRLDWETTNEIGLLGFNVYRSETIDGGKQKLNTTLIAAKKRGQLLGAVYQYEDPIIPGEQFFYWLELVQIGGSDQVGPLSMNPNYWINLPVVVK